MEAVALHDFNATSDDELSFKKGFIVKILDTEEDMNWFRAEYQGQEGMIPGSYIQMKPNPWYKGKMKRDHAEEYLNKINVDGLFLVRLSESSRGDFSLSVSFQNSVQHFKVLRDSSGKYFLWIIKFNSLNQLIDHHRRSSVSRSQTIFLKELKTEEKLERKVRALYSFIGEEGELTFKKGDIITILEDADPNWFRGKKLVDGQIGLFPYNYVEEMP